MRSASSTTRNRSEDMFWKHSMSSSSRISHNLPGVATTTCKDFPFLHCKSLRCLCSDNPPTTATVSIGKAALKYLQTSLNTVVICRASSLVGEITMATGETDALHVDQLLKIQLRIGNPNAFALLMKKMNKFNHTKVFPDPVSATPTMSTPGL